MNTEINKFQTKNKFDFDIFDQKCLCEIKTKETASPCVSNSDQISSSSNDEEEDYFELFLPEFDKYMNEFENLFAPISSPAYSLIRFKDEFRGPDQITMINFIEDVENFFVHKTETKVTQLKACPNSMIPILPRKNLDEDCAPTYFTDIEYRKFLKPFNLGNKSFVVRNTGLNFIYDSERKLDLQSNYVIGNRSFYTKLFNDRMGKSKINKDKINNEINLPIALYEAKTLIKRLCDIFIYFPLVFEDIYMICQNDILADDYVLNKIASAIIAGLHKVVSSQGIPLTALIGETYETFNRFFYLFAEVRRDQNPLTINYNIRFRDRFITLNGWVEMCWEYREKQDIVKIKIVSYNKMKINCKEDPIRIYEFNLPGEIVVAGIIEEIQSESIRLITVNSFIYIKGPLNSIFILFNSEEDNETYLKMVKLLDDKLANIESLETMHNCVGIIHDSFNIEIDNFAEEAAHHQKENLNKYPTKETPNNKQVSTVKSDISRSKFEFSNRASDEAKAFLKFLNVIRGNYLYFLLKTSDQGPIKNLFVGSWLDLYFFDFNLKMKTLNFLQFKPFVKFESIKFDSNQALIDYKSLNNNFLKHLKNELWDKVKIPICSDTRYREDLIWVYRYFKFLISSQKELGGALAEIEKNMQEALKYAVRWKEILEGYTSIFINKNLK